MIVGLDHVQLAMPPGKENAVRTYCIEVLGLAEVDKPASLAGRGGAWFGLGDEWQIHYGVEAAFQPNRKAHPAFVVNDLDGLAARLAAAGYPVNWDEALAPRRRFYSSDPFGNRLEFMERSEEGKTYEG